MKFRQRRHREEPEINFIPLIDVMLVILIFVMATTTYSKFAELKINLPTADAEKAAETPQTVQISISAGGQYSINEQLQTFSTPDEFALQLRKAAGNNPDPMIVINADGQASHQSVVNVMEAARLAGFGKLTFATQTK
ncbi:biopolymer transport protein ExbD [Andreprevotia lacus DSM 23236]|jgi:biopolymer transport protein ExbD|uniref:Biopolymer transport protein ExbD n=1 Tax=Andreprevotia lacus DSM 23236 TaxID=1121001 RepID=A0A1W1XK53_9NEIS|nr:biopolymer transporter ExbD [Andreprevotia lacus]SMC24370.1 biopolymer transport protein ExbD [Andreprevotia lacus DSM 23236]